MPRPEHAPLRAASPALAALAVLSPVALGACDDNRTWLAPSAYEPQAPPALTCVPDLDGQVTAAELAPAFGVPASYLVSPASAVRPVDPVGTVDPAGRRVWDLSEPDTDPVISVVARPATGHWAAASFPSDAFVVPLDAGQSIDAFYRHTEAELTLIGLASRLADPPEGRTLWTYAAPVTLYRFPLADGQRWTSVGEVRNGTVRGLPYAGRDTYEFEVSQTGQLLLPDLTFTQTLRVKSRLVTQPAVGQSVSRNQISWIFECFGEVARLVSEPGEASSDFTRAAEIRRLGL